MNQKTNNVNQKHNVEISELEPKFYLSQVGFRSVVGLIVNTFFTKHSHTATNNNQ